jgi:hypothetical protein
MWRNVVEPNRLKMTIWRKSIACWIPSATQTHSEYVILILLHCNNGCKNVPTCNVVRTDRFKIHFKVLGRIISSLSARTFFLEAYGVKIIISYKKYYFKEHCYYMLLLIYATTFQSQKLPQLSTVPNKAINSICLALSPVWAEIA